MYQTWWLAREICTESCFRMICSISKLEQLECLHSEICPATPWLPILVVHIRFQVKIKTKLKLQILKIDKASNFIVLQQTVHTTYVLKLLDKMYKYEMDPTRIVGATEQTRDAGQTDGRTDGQTDGWTDGVQTIYLPTTSLCRGYNKWINRIIG